MGDVANETLHQDMEDLQFAMRHFRKIVRKELALDVILDWLSDAVRAVGHAFRLSA